MNIDAILWDYDGTLVNSVPKNIDITKQILSSVAPRFAGGNLPKYLISEELYHVANHQAENWQDLYLNYYGMTESEMLEAGTLWTEFQLKNTTPVELFSGIKKTINEISLPQGICSQNSSENIKRVLQLNKLNNKFQSIIGYDDIPSKSQKPAAYSGILCLKNIFGSTLIDKTILYIGDHEGDVVFARNIEKELINNCRIISITAKYSGANIENWINKPDFVIENPKNLIEIINNS
ncbi:MAG: HAD hydrolase-like protein [Bacteroidales bacterium]|jgi:phosphoglycolate phosphatase-like HAD superfamily hydrolase|nr:HAD hydrolase-like protein [Bacteroidales bacterium]